MDNLNLRKGDTMEIIKGVQDFPDLPTRMGKRPITIRGPLHVQCGGHSDEGVLHQLVQQVIAWPGIEAGPLPIVHRGSSVPGASRRLRNR